MDFLFIYLIKSALSLSILYLAYEFLFRKEVYFNFSRIFLLASVFLVILLPLLPYNAASVLSKTPFTLGEIVIYSQLAHFTLDEVVINANSQPDYFFSTFTVGSILLTLYILGVIIKSLLFIFRLFQIQSLIRRSKTMSSDGLNFVFAEKGSPTYSFLKWIFIDPELFEKTNDFSAIVAHEKIHASEGHTYDLILAELLTIIQWFNPFAYLLKKSIKENHEYITDQEVISNHQDPRSYQLLLLEHSTKIKLNSLTHNFSCSLLERRLKMMKKSKHKLGFGLRLLAVSSTLVLIFFACSSPQEKTQKATAEIAIEQVFLVVEKMPEYIGGQQAMYKFIGDNIKYPDQAKEENIEGRVFISFIVEKDGRIANVEILRGIGGGCDEEAKRVIEKMPNWTPGQQRGENVRVQYRMPIKFALNGENPETKEEPLFQVVEVMPEYEGGKSAMYKFLQSNIEYPETAKKQGTQGTVYVGFIIEKDGKISSVEIKKGIGDGCDEEAVRVIKNMPNWTPGKQRGKDVRVAYTLPIKFNLQ
jgi:TonB family protein